MRQFCQNDHNIYQCCNEAWTLRAINRSADALLACSLEMCRFDEQITNEMRLFVKLVWHKRPYVTFERSNQTNTPGGREKCHSKHVYCTRCALYWHRTKATQFPFTQSRAITNLLFDPCFKPLWKHRRIVDVWKNSSYESLSRKTSTFHSGDNLAYYWSIPVYEVQYVPKSWLLCTHLLSNRRQLINRGIHGNYMQNVVKVVTV